MSSTDPRPGADPDPAATASPSGDQSSGDHSGESSGDHSGESSGDQSGDRAAAAPPSPEAPERPEAPADDPATHRFECRSCGYVFDPAEGLSKLGIAAGTAFVDLDPVSFRCPVCRSRMPLFRDIGPRNKPSGFEENLNFGFGVNRLTPGQKNVLIFGGFALAIAFFLSLYSLR